MPLKKYVVRLSDAERVQLLEVAEKLKGTSQKVKRAYTLFHVDADGPAWTDKRIDEAYRCQVRAMEGAMRRLCEEGFEKVLHGKKPLNPPLRKKLDGRQEAELVTLRLGPPRKGFASWNPKLVAGQTMALGITEPDQTISSELVRRTQKSNGVLREAALPQHTLDAAATKSRADIKGIYGGRNVAVDLNLGEGMVKAWLNTIAALMK